MIYTSTTFKYAFDYKPSDIYWYAALLIDVNLLLKLFQQMSQKNYVTFSERRIMSTFVRAQFGCSAFRCTADCGWITGHSYVTYGPLLNGATVIVYEGVTNSIFLWFIKKSDLGCENN